MSVLCIFELTLIANRIILLDGTYVGRVVVPSSLHLSARFVMIVLIYAPASITPFPPKGSRGFYAP